MHRDSKVCFRLSAGSIIAILAISAIPSLAADSAPAPEWSLVTIVTVKPEMRSDFEAWQKEVSAAFKKAEVPSRAVLQTVMGDVFEYVSVVPLAHFADMDGPSPIERAMGKADAAGFMQKGAAYVTSVHRVATRALNDMSISNKSSDAGDYAMVTSLHLVAGKESEFNDL